MSNNIQIFQNSEFGSIRVMEDEGVVWFIGREVASILGYCNTRDAVRRHVEKSDKTDAAIHDGRQNRHCIIINESGLYSLIVRSNLQSAKRFKRWITSDVLVSIRKYGLYATKELLDNPDLLIEAAEKLKEEKTKRNQRKENTGDIQPASAFAAAVGNCVSAILIRDYVRILANANIKMGQYKLFKWLNSKGYIYRDKTLDQWMAYKKYVDMGIFSVTQSRIMIPNFGDKLSFTIKITEIGQTYFYEELRKEYIKN